MKDYSFGNFICELRMRNGLSQFQLGTLVGVSNKAVSKWENGAAMPKISTCHKLALVLGVSIDELLACKYHIPAPAEKGIFAMKKELWKKAELRLHEVYGTCPHVSIQGRFETEKQMMHGSDLIVHFGFLTKLAEATRAAGSEQFIFGHINSSFVAWLLGVTPVNPLEPHYYCPVCQRVEFHPEIADGWDLPEKDCTCGHRLKQDGHSIPCESALMRLVRSTSFDINLPFDLQKEAGQMLKDYFADTVKIVEIIFKDRVGGLPMSRFVMLPIEDGHNNARTLQMSFEEYAQKFGKTPHYTFLSHINAEVLNRLCNKTNRSPENIDFLDQKVLRAYHFGDIPEFLEHEHSVLPMMRHFAPDLFSDILQVHGFRHGTCVWEGNGEALVRNGIAKPKELIAFSENIYGSILKKMQTASITGTGLALNVMDNTRLGHYYKYGMPKTIESNLLQLGLPAWYIDSMKKIRYLFPKGHAVSFLKTEMRLVWFAIKHPNMFSSVIKGIQREYKSHFEERDVLIAKLK